MKFNPKTLSNLYGPAAIVAASDQCLTYTAASDLSSLRKWFNTSSSHVRTTTTTDRSRE